VCVCVCVCVCVFVCVCVHASVHPCLHPCARTHKPPAEFHRCANSARPQNRRMSAFTLRFLISQGVPTTDPLPGPPPPPPLLLLLTPHLSLFTFGSGNAFGPIALAALTEEAGDFESGHVSGLQNALCECLLRYICRQACSETGRRRMQRLTY
jgi:hypothetical protein